MKYRPEIEIDLPRDKVVALFFNPDNLKHWQPELISFSHAAADPGKWAPCRRCASGWAAANAK